MEWKVISLDIPGGKSYLTQLMRSEASVEKKKNKEEYNNNNIEIPMYNQIDDRVYSRISEHS